MTSNLGAAEMGSMLRPNLGFAAGDGERKNAAGIVDEALGGKVMRAGVEAARRKFSPEFMNRIDKIVVFHPLGAPELRKILTIELNVVQQRIFTAANAAPFVFTLTEDAKDFLLLEGTDMKYGARRLDVLQGRRGYAGLRHGPPGRHFGRAAAGQVCHRRARSVAQAGHDVS